MRVTDTYVLCRCINNIELNSNQMCILIASPRHGKPLESLNIQCFGLYWVQNTSCNLQQTTRSENSLANKRPRAPILFYQEKIFVFIVFRFYFILQVVKGFPFLLVPTPLCHNDVRTQTLWLVVIL